MSAPSTERATHRHVFTGIWPGEHNTIHLACLVGSCGVRQRIQATTRAGRPFGPRIEVAYFDANGTPIRGDAAGQGGGQAPFVALVVTPEPNVPD